MRATEILDYATRKKIPNPKECASIFTHATREELSAFRKKHKKEQREQAKQHKD